MRRAAALLALGAAAWPTVAAAHDPLSLFGFGARAAALAGALTADASGQAAAFYNPGGVARSDDVEVAASYSYGFMQLRFNDEPADVPTPRGVSLGLSVPLRIRSARLAFGVALHLPDQFLARIWSTPVAEPRFILLDNSPNRIVVQPVLSLRPWPWLSIGAGATLLADAAGNGVDFDVGVVAGEKVSRAGLDVALPIRAAPVAGIVVEPIPRLRLGLSYRGAIDLKVRIAIAAHVDIAGAVQGTTAIALRSASYYTPRRLALGASFDLLPSLTAHAEVAWNEWSAWDGAPADLRIAIALGVVPSLVPWQPPVLQLRDTWVPRAGLEYRRRFSPHFGLAARSGLAWEPSPVPDQVGLASLVDNDRVVVTHGLGLLFEDVPWALEGPLRLDLAVGWHQLLGRETRKDPSFFPGRDFSSGGRIFHLSATVETRF